MKKIAEVKVEIELCYQDRYEREKAEHDAKIKAREASVQARGRKLGGKKPIAPKPGPKASA